MPYPLLSKIELPDDLRALPEEELQRLAAEIRTHMIESVSQTGGHLAASLGTVELTIALHYIFNTPEDRIVWDVGHQAYAHKMLTGRRDAMCGLRQKGGIAGFPKRDESIYDCFGTGHSSTSIGAALGMAIAAGARQSRRRAIAVIGDGAMGAGMAFEALNHAGDLGANLLVILNDNEMSISPNVGALSNYLGRILSGRTYQSMREGGKSLLSGIPHMHELARRAEEHVKGMIVPGTLFEEFGFNYIGPVDGHDLPGLLRTLRNVRSIDGPQLVHIKTRKGKGYHPAESDPSRFHGVGRFQRENGESLATSKPGGPSYTEVFGNWLCDMAAQDPDLVAITPAMKTGSGLTAFAKRYAERYFDVGIAEQHSLTLAAGLACEGMRPVVAIYSTFLQRAYDQLIHDIALQNLPVTLAIDRAGLVGPDGPTHAGSFDFSYLRCIPNMVVMAPADENECRQMLSTAHRHPGPAAVRYPRGTGPGASVQPGLEPLPLGEGAIVREGRNVALLAFGTMVETATGIADVLDATVANMRFVKPLDHALIDRLAGTHRWLVTLEENARSGGAGSAVSEYLAESGEHPGPLIIGLPDGFASHGSRKELLEDCGLGAEQILARIQSWIAARDCLDTRDRLIS